MRNHCANDLKKIGMFLEGLAGAQFSDKRIPLKFGNLPVHIYPDRTWLVVRRENDAWAMETMRWGFPPPASSVTARLTRPSAGTVDFVG